MKTQTDKAVNKALKRLIHVNPADVKAIREHDGKFYHLPSGEYISRENAVKCHPLNVELH